MKKAVKHLEQFLERAEGYTKGKVVLATVYGDVHDIGKSLVNTILSNNGYTVFDLGKQVPVNTIIEKALEVGRRRDRPVGAARVDVEADAAVRAGARPARHQDSGAHRRRGDQPPLRPARAVRRRRARVRLGRVLLQGRVRGARDDGPASRTRSSATPFIEQAARRRAQRQVPRTRTSARTVRRARPAAQRSDVTPTTRCRRRRSSARARSTDIPLDEVFALLDLDELYRLQWGGRGSGPEYDATVKNEFEPTLARLEGVGEARRLARSRTRSTATSRRSRRATTSSSTIRTPYAKDGTTREIARFHFPRQEGRERLCIADYFRSVESGDVDVVAFQIVTVGDEATREVSRRCRAAGEYTEAFYVHGLAVETAEAVAEWMHRKHASRARRAGGSGQALLVGLRRLSRSRGSRAAVQDPAGGARARHGAHERVPAHSRAEHRGDHRASSAGEVLRRARRGARSGAHEHASSSASSIRTRSSSSTARWARCCTARACSSISATTS